MKSNGDICGIQLKGKNRAHLKVHRRRSHREAHEKFQESREHEIANISSQSDSCTTSRLPQTQQKLKDIVRETRRLTLCQWLESTRTNSSNFWSICLFLPPSHQQGTACIVKFASFGSSTHWRVNCFINLTLERLGINDVVILTSF